MMARLILLALFISLGAWAQPNCNIAPDGRGGTAEEQSVARASSLLTDADEILGSCSRAGTNQQWQACLQADRLINESDRMLNHVFRFSFERRDDGTRCWKCRPGSGEFGLQGVAPGYWKAAVTMLLQMSFTHA